MLVGGGTPTRGEIILKLCNGLSDFLFRGVRSIVGILSNQYGHPMVNLK
jgi:hypothetical protein